MAKKSSLGDSELNLDSLMDAVTNVVGVLMIVFVMMALNTARTVQKVLSDLPPVTKEQHEEMQKQVKTLPPPPADPKQLVEDKKKTETALLKAIEQLKTVDVVDLESKMKFMDLDSFRKQLEVAKKQRETQKVEVDKLLVELERLKALLDQTPVYQPPPPTFVRLPNPRPFPGKVNETRVMVAKQGLLFLNDKNFMQPIVDGLEKIKSQLEYKEPIKIDPFAKLLQGIFGGMPAAQQAWPELAPLVSTFQMEPLAQAYKILAAANFAPNKSMLQSLGDISIVTRAPLPAVAEAVVAATQGNLSKWTALDPSRDPLKPTIKATSSGGKITFTWGAKAEEVKATPKDVLNYFVKDLAGLDGIKNVSRSKVIYDAFKIQQILERVAANPTFTGSYEMKPAVRPGAVAVQIALVPKAGGGETTEQIRAEGSSYQRLLRQVKGDPNGVAIFQVMSDAFTTYLEARKIADEIGVAATWEFLARLDITINVPGYEVQRFTPAPIAAPVVPGTAPAVRIAAPTRKLD
ncbi:MAG: hypothetical protein U0984_15480 [Prosthecobacter sp.]|nr:hypothetical protein [Prosthecobacter sp.]